MEQYRFDYFAEINEIMSENSELDILSNINYLINSRWILTLKNRPKININAGFHYGNSPLRYNLNNKIRRTHYPQFANSDNLLILGIDLITENSLDDHDSINLDALMEKAELYRFKQRSNWMDQFKCLN